MLLVQISDLHLREDGADPRHDPAEALARAFALIAKVTPRADAILLSGDVIDRSAPGYDRAAELLARAPARLMPMPGNHDRPAEFRAAFGAMAPYAEGHLSFSHPLPGATLIALDSNLPEGGGGLDEARLAWLDDALAKANGPVVLALHHPPFPTGIPRLDEDGFTGAEALAQRLGAGGKVRRLIAGHTHRVIHTLWSGVPASTGPALAHALALSLVPGAAHAHTAEPPALHIHRAAGGEIVTHLVSLARGAEARGFRAALTPADQARLIAP